MKSLVLHKQFIPSLPQPEIAVLQLVFEMSLVSEEHKDPMESHFFQLLITYWKVSNVQIQPSGQCLLRHATGLTSFGTFKI